MLLEERGDQLTEVHRLDGLARLSVGALDRGGTQLLHVLEVLRGQLRHLLADGIDHRDALPALGEVELRALVGHLGAAGHRHRRSGDELLGEVHQVLVGGVGLVELQHRELGVVAGAHPLVAEVPVDLVDALDAADHQPLEVQLGGDPHDQRDVQGVVVRDERARRRAGDERVHHRRLDLEVVARVEEVADVAHQPVAPQEDLLHLRIGDEVQVALAVARLHVLQAVPLLGHGAQGLGERREALGGEGQLAGLGAEERPLGGVEVAEIGELEELEGLVPEDVLLHVDLQLAGAVAQLDEGGLAEAVAGDDAAGDVVDRRSFGGDRRRRPAPRAGSRTSEIRCLGR